MHVSELATPALVVDLDLFEHNVAVMGAAWPGTRLRPHVKAFKSTALAAELAAAGHVNICAATPKEILGLARAGLGDDLLLANEVLSLERLVAMANCGARVTVAVDSEATIAAAHDAGIQEVLIDVDVGLMRCGCPPKEAGALGALARRRGLSVRGVMGYEGHLMMEGAASKEEKVEAAMAVLLEAHDDVGGEVISGGGTGTYHVNRWITELQAGTFTLMDTDYEKLALPFAQAVLLHLSVISVNPAGWAVGDGGLKALGMDHGNPRVLDRALVFCSDEHTTFAPAPGDDLPAVGDRIRVAPAHLDPTLAYHERLYVSRGDEVLGEWPIDLRNW
jgi:D-serine deaminase-like pyridoxal phosphate-dependent protein